MRKVNIPDCCRVYSGAFAECGIEELILGEHVILEEGCFEGIRAKQVNIPDTTKWIPCPDDDESASSSEALPVSKDGMDDLIGVMFRSSKWHYMELLKHARKGEKWAVEEFASGMSSRISAYQEDSWKFPISPDEILSLMDENEKQWISQFEENRSNDLNMSLSDDDLPF